MSYINPVAPITHNSSDVGVIPGKGDEWASTRRSVPFRAALISRLFSVPANVMLKLSNQVGLFDNGLLDQIANRQQTDQLAVFHHR